ncbi:MAG TPA: HAMP domain-containing sensor histidine kinase [Planktothrix sp.]|jgi:two-component system sensor histidine kinase CpxA
MRIRFPLYAQTIGYLLLHLGLLSLVFLILFNTQFGRGWEALLYSPAGDRVDAIAGVLRNQTLGVPTKQWNGILEQWGKFYGVTFYLFDNHKDQLAGPPVALPEEVAAHMARMLPAGFAHGHHGQGQVQQVTPVPLSERDQISHRRFLVRTRDPELFWVGMRIVIYNKDDNRPERLLLLATTPNLWQTRLFFDVGPLLTVALGIFLISILFWWPFVYRITRALWDLTKATNEIAEGKFDTRLNTRRSDEIGSLAESVNVMAERLENFVSGQKRFLGAIAHELCSPVSRLQIALELLEASGTSDQERVISDIREEVHEMSSLINELLAFSKAGIQGKDIQLVAVNIEPVIRTAIQKISSEHLISVDVGKNLTVLGDQLLLERAFSNIFRNAVRYAAKDGPITVHAHGSDDGVVVTTRDSGPGVPPESIKMLGEPFYRPEPSRSRASGGVGLGLAIVKTCVEACEGVVHVRNRQPRGLEVELCLKSCPRTSAESNIPAPESVSS